MTAAHRYDFNMTFSNPGVQRLQAAAAAAPDAASFRCTVSAGEDWAPYLDAIMDGIWERCECQGGSACPCMRRVGRSKRRRRRAALPARCPYVPAQCL